MFATVIGIFAPAGKYRKFVSLVLGFVLLLLMIQPLAGFFRGRDIPVTQWFAGISDGGGSLRGEFDYSMWWDNYFSQAFETQLETQLTRLLAENGFAVYSAEFSFADDFEIAAIHVGVSRTEKPEAGRVPFIRIQPPQIRPIQIGETPSAESCPDSLAVKNLISEFYSLPLTHIHVNVK
jgi:energy-coupling factor transporter transmembrane protein EcfT